MTSSTLILSILTVLTILTVVTAHSDLGKPESYNPTACKASESWCKGSCPPIYKSGKAKARNSATNPADTWGRGEKVEIIWHKNNHVGGFYRRSLVPISHMFDEDWHKKSAFDFGCWSQGTFNCGKKNSVCGADLKGRAYKNEVTIPAVFPDGDYVFAQVWYGGLHWQGKYSKYSDYFSCSFIRIRGGLPLANQISATFTGDKKECSTGKTYPLDCDGDGCIESNGKPRPAFTGVPREFQNGRVPVVQASTFGVEVMADKEIVVENPANAEQAVEEMKQDQQEDIQSAKESGYADGSSPSPIPTTEPSTSSETTTSTTSSSGVDITRETNSDYRGPVDSVYVIVGAQVVATLKDGDKAEIETDGKPVTFEAYTGLRNIGNIWFKIPNEKTYREARAPYVYQGHRGNELSGYRAWRDPIYEEMFKLSVVHWKGSSRTELQVELILHK